MSEEVEFVRSNLRAAGVEDKLIEKYVKYLLSSHCRLKPVSVDEEKQGFDLWLAVETSDRIVRNRLCIIIAFFILLMPFLIAGLWMWLSSLSMHALATVAVLFLIVTGIILIVRGGR